jgi:hypothetical protein
VKGRDHLEDLVVDERISVVVVVVREGKRPLGRPSYR